MTTTNSDNSEMKVIKVKPEEIQEHLDKTGYRNCTVSGTFCKVRDEREQNLDAFSSSSASSDTSSNASESSATSSTSSTSGANKANIEFGDANIAFIMDLLQADRIQELRLVDPNRSKETRAQQEKGERE